MADFSVVPSEIATDEWLAIGTVQRETYGASPGSQTYKWQFKSTDNSSTVNMADAKIIAIKEVDQGRIRVLDHSTTGAFRQFFQQRSIMLDRPELT